MKPWLDDPEVPPEMRLDLLASRAAARRYDVEAQEPRLLAACAEEAPLPPHLDEVARGPELLTWPSLYGWKLGATLLFGCVATGLFTWSLWPTSPGTSSHASGGPSQGEHVDSAAVHPRNAPPAEKGAQAGPSAFGSSQGEGARAEIEQMVRIRALLATDPRAAHTLILRSQAQFPRGVFVEERLAFLVQTFAARGQHEQARARARAFVTRYPHSAMRDSVESVLRD